MPETRKTNWLTGFIFIYLSCYLGYSLFSHYNGDEPRLGNINGEESLYYAAKEGDLDKARLLLDGGAVIDGQKIKAASVAKTPLEVAILYNHYDVFLLLAEHGADINLINEDGAQPIHAASRPQVTDLRIIEHLLIKGADIHAVNKYGQQPIHIASDIGEDPFTKQMVFNPELIRLLVKAGADIESKLQERTPLLMAAGKSNFEAVKALTELGADIEAKDQNNMNALEIVNASKRGLEERTNQESKDSKFISFKQGYIERYKQIFEYLLDYKISSATLVLDE